jgi:hypothetical protein
MNTRRNITGFVLILVMTIPFASQLFIQLKITANRNLMMQQLDQASLVTLSVPVSTLHWIVPGKEILLDNRMFDIKKIQVNDNIAVITGLFDDVEKALVTQQAGQHQNTPSLNKLLAQLFSGGYDHSFSEQIAVHAPNECTIQTGNRNIIHYLSAFIPVEAPPPWYS